MAVQLSCWFSTNHTGELIINSHFFLGLRFSVSSWPTRTTTCTYTQQNHTYKQGHSTWICAARSGLIAMVTRDTVPVGQWAFCSSVFFGWSGTSDRTLASVLKNNDWDSTQSLWHLIEERSPSLRSQSKGHSLMIINSLEKKPNLSFIWMKEYAIWRGGAISLR